RSPSQSDTFGPPAPLSIHTAPTATYTAKAKTSLSTHPGTATGWGVRAATAEVSMSAVCVRDSSTGAGAVPADGPDAAENVRQYRDVRVRQLCRRDAVLGARTQEVRALTLGAVMRAWPDGGRTTLPQSPGCRATAAVSALRYR